MPYLARSELLNCREFLLHLGLVFQIDSNKFNFSLDQDGAFYAFETVAFGSNGRDAYVFHQGDVSVV